MIYAEDLNYWKSGQSSPDTWIDKAKREIAAAGGKVVSEAYGKDETGRAAFLLEFSFAGERFKAIWPVLKSRAGNERAAAEVELGRVADAYEAGMLVPVGEAATVPLPAFLIMCVVVVVLIATILLVG